MDLEPVTTVRVGSDAAEARRRAAEGDFPYVLVVDERNRPIEWCREDAIPAEGAVAAADGLPATPIFDRFTTLKDALSMLLATDVQAGIVVDDAGAVRGLVTEAMISERIRAPVA